MIKGFSVKKIVIAYEEGVAAAYATVEFEMESSKPDIDALTEALTGFILKLRGQTTL